MAYGSFWRVWGVHEDPLCPAAESAVSWYPGYEAPFGSGGTFDEFILVFFVVFDTNSIKRAK